MKYLGSIRARNIEEIKCHMCGETISGTAEMFLKEENGRYELLFYHPQCLPPELKKEAAGENTLLKWLRNA